MIDFSGSVRAKHSRSDEVKTGPENCSGFSVEGNSAGFLRLNRHRRTRPMTKSKMTAPIVETAIALIIGSAIGIETPRRGNK